MANTPITEAADLTLEAYPKNPCDGERCFHSGRLMVYVKSAGAWFPEPDPAKIAEAVADLARVKATMKLSEFMGGLKEVKPKELPHAELYDQSLGGRYHSLSGVAEWFDRGFKKKYTIAGCAIGGCLPKEADAPQAYVNLVNKIRAHRATYFKAMDIIYDSVADKYYEVTPKRAAEALKIYPQIYVWDYGFTHIAEAPVFTPSATRWEMSDLPCTDVDFWFGVGVAKNIGRTPGVPERQMPGYYIARDNGGNFIPLQADHLDEYAQACGQTKEFMLNALKGKLLPYDEALAAWGSKPAPPDKLEAALKAGENAAVPSEPPQDPLAYTSFWGSIQYDNESGSDKEWRFYRRMDAKTEDPSKVYIAITPHNCDVVDQLKDFLKKTGPKYKITAIVNVPTRPAYSLDPLQEALKTQPEAVIYSVSAQGTCNELWRWRAGQEGAPLTYTFPESPPELKELAKDFEKLVEEKGYRKPIAPQEQTVANPVPESKFVPFNELVAGFTESIKGAPARVGGAVGQAAAVKVALETARGLGVFAAQKALSGKPQAANRAAVVKFLNSIYGDVALGFVLGVAVYFVPLRKLTLAQRQRLSDAFISQAVITGGAALMMLKGKDIWDEIVVKAMGLIETLENVVAAGGLGDESEAEGPPTPQKALNAAEAMARPSYLAPATAKAEVG